jgi:hypothetical protein
MNKACFVLIALMSPASLFAGETMVTTHTTSGCDFRVDKCQTSVATDPSYEHYKDGVSTHVGDVTPLSGDPAAHGPAFGFANYTAVHHLTLDELLALIRSKLSNCPEVTVTYDNDTGFITVHYLKSTCDCDCDWVVNVRNVKANDFVLKRTTDNYSNRLGQMERLKFHCASEADAEDIQSACSRICALNNWTMWE